MDTTKYFKSVSAELVALKDRVRSFIDDAHWQTDGEWKESVLRTVLRRVLPRNVEVGRGFVVSPTQTSSQIDVIIYSGDVPILFRDGDLVFITPDALLGMIEVKTGVNNQQIAEAAMKISDNTERIGQSRYRYITGLFCYEDRSTTAEGVLEAFRAAAQGNRDRVIDFAAVGQDRFVRWWRCTRVATGTPIDLWRSYRLHEMAAAYFIHNIAEFICPDAVGRNQDAWYPREGKESYEELAMSLRGAE